MVIVRVRIEVLFEVYRMKCDIRGIYINVDEWDSCCSKGVIVWKCYVEWFEWMMRVFDSLEGV